MKSDEALVAETIAGELGAFDQLMLRYQKLVCKVAMNYVRNKQSGLDVTQNVFLKVYNNLGSVTSDGMFKPWLLRITYNESINWLRKAKRQREEAGDFETAVDPSANQESTVLDNEDKRRVARSLGQLNPKYRLALALRYAEGMRIREIASVMECSEGMVKSLLFRGVRQIKSAVAKSA